jgi:hypothetical protein
MLRYTPTEALGGRRVIRREIEALLGRTENAVFD